MNKVSFNHLGRLGRLGNCMFQYATVLGAARSSGHVPVCNLSAAPLMSEFFVLGSVADGVNDNEFIVGVEPQNHFGFSKHVLELPQDKNVDLYGYFQTEKHFKHIEEEVRQNFTFRPTAIEKAARKIPVDGPCVSVHVRRGDYTAMTTYHPLLTIEYYNSAISQFKGYRPVFFSDDIEWCKSVFKDTPNGPVFVDNEIHISKDGTTQSDASGYVDMCAMSMCKGHVIANSSFSWWGAWLGGGKTVAPKTWFGPDGPKDWQDIYCNDWCVL